MFYKHYKHFKHHKHFKHFNMSEPHLQRDAAKAVPTNTLLSRMRLFVVATADVVTV